MSRSFFSKDIEPRCSYCTFGKLSDEGSVVLCCKIGGVMQPESSCRKFRYDPLKREPKAAPLHLNGGEGFTKEDFSL